MSTCRVCGNNLMHWPRCEHGCCHRPCCETAEGCPDAGGDDSAA